MKTTLPTAIGTIDEAKAFLTELHSNNELYHPEDDAHTIDWVTMHDEDKPTPAECDQLNTLMGQIYLLPGNDGRHNSPLAFDPCLFLIILDQRYISDQLQQAVKDGKFDYDKAFQYTIEKGPDQYNPCYELTIISDGSIFDTFEYNTREDAEHDVELLEHITSIEEA